MTARPRSDGYPDHRFRLAWEGRTVADFASAGPLPGFGDHPPTVRRMPGQDDGAPITLERGVTRDAGFLRWAAMVHGQPNGDIDDLARDLTLDLCDAAGQRVVRYRLYACLPRAFAGLPTLDSEDEGTAIASLTLAVRRCEHDVFVPGVAGSGSSAC